MVSWVGVNNLIPEAFKAGKLDDGEVTHWTPMPEGPKND